MQPARDLACRRSQTRRSPNQLTTAGPAPGLKPQCPSPLVLAKIIHTCIYNLWCWYTADLRWCSGWEFRSCVKVEVAVLGSRPFLRNLQFLWTQSNSSTNFPCQSSRAEWKSRWTAWASVPNKPTFSVDVKQHFSYTSIDLYGWTERPHWDRMRHIVPTLHPQAWPAERPHRDMVRYDVSYLH